MKKSIFLFFTLITISVNCNSQSVVDSIQNKLLGKWFSNDQLTSIEFSNDKVYKFSVNNEEFFTENYQIVLSDDSIFMYNYNNKYRADNDKYDTTKYLLYLNGNELLQVNYKYGLGINGHIDEFGFFYKQGTNNMQQNTKKNEANTYLLPTNFIGQIMIAYNGGIKKNLSKEKIINIPNSGFLEIENEEDIQNYTRQNFRFCYETLVDCEKKQIKKIDVFRKYSTQELEEYKENDVFVISLGYNQLNRPDINTIFGKKIVGNVEFYVVNTFKNLVKYLKK